MKLLLATVLSLSLVGCSTTVPVKIQFPAVPEILMEPAGNLTPLDKSNNPQISDLIENANDNAGKYYELKEKYNAWQEWYRAQKSIHEDIYKK